MTIIANSRNGRTKSNYALVSRVINTRKPELADLGYSYAFYKLPGEEKATRGFIFKPRNCVLEIDQGFEFDEKNYLVYDPAFKSTRLRDEFYFPINEVPAVAAAALQEDGIHPDLDRIQDLPPAPVPTHHPEMVPNHRMSTEELMTFLTEEDRADIKRQLAYTLIVGKQMGITVAPVWQQATSLAGVHFIPSFDPRYRESLRS